MHIYLVDTGCGKRPVLVRMASHGHWEHILLINAISGVEEHLWGSKSIRRIERYIPWASNAHQMQTHCFLLEYS